MVASDYGTLFTRDGELQLNQARNKTTKMGWMDGWREGMNGVGARGARARVSHGW